MVIFTDMVLFCKKVNKKNEENTLRIVRPPLRIDRLKCTELKDNSKYLYGRK